MRVIVCGSIGYGGVEDIRRVQDFLREKGFDVIDQLKFDYTDIGDFRDRKDLWGAVVRTDLELCSEADVIVFVVKRPSFGAMAEVVISSLKGKPIVAYCPEEVRSPWPLYFSDVTVKRIEELPEAIKSAFSKQIRTIPNVYGDHEAEFVYEDFTCICPVTGRRDRARIRIRYRPRYRLIEYESLQRYFSEFRDKEMHHEAVVERIFDDIMRAVKPKSLEVVAEFEERSGVVARIRRYYES